MGVVTSKGGRRTKTAIFRIGLVAFVLIAVALAFSFTQERATTLTAAAPQTSQQFTRLGNTTIHATPIGSGAFADPEIDTFPHLGDEPGIKPGESGDAAKVFLGSAAVTGKAPHHMTNLAIPRKAAARAAAASFHASSNSSTFPPPEPNVPASFVVGFQAPGFHGFNGIRHMDSAHRQWRQSIQRRAARSGPLRRQRLRHGNRQRRRPRFRHARQSC